MKYTPDFSSRFRILKGGKISLVVSALMLGSTMTFASPSGGTVTTGSANINQNGSITTINQSTNKASINWQSFNIAPSETVNFVQPSASSVTLNRVVGTTNSLIEGVMNANGQVFLVNPNGVVFSKTATVNVGGLVATTQNITDENFQNGNYKFEGNSQNSVLNMGTITATNGGYVAMIGKTVQNEGTIVATMGNVQLAGANKVSLNLNGNSLVKLTIDEGTLNALVENKGLIKADGGQVYLTTQALNTILDGMVNNSGVIEAKTLNDVTGNIVAYTHGGTTNISGTLDATGGSIETSGEVLYVSDGTSIKAKKWLLDPTNVTIESTGNSDLAGSSVSASAIETALETADVEIQASHDITVNQAINVHTVNNSGYTAGGLVLTAGNDININNVITLGPEAYLVLNHGWNGTAYNGSNGAAIYGHGGKITFGMNAAKTDFVGKVAFAPNENVPGSENSKIFINDVEQTIIHNATELQDMQNGLTGNYVLGGDLNMNGVDFTPIGSKANNSDDYSLDFKGTFNGLGNTISNLTISTTYNWDDSSYGATGLFGNVSGSAVISNVRLSNATVTNTATSNVGPTEVGALVGYARGEYDNNNYLIAAPMVHNNIVTDSAITSDHGWNVGGIVGGAEDNVVLSNNAVISTTVVSTEKGYVGGIAGYVSGNVTIDNAYVSGTTITAGGAEAAGAIVGSLESQSELKNSYADNNIIAAKRDVGGLVGILDDIGDDYKKPSTITNSFYKLDDTSINGSTGVITYGGIYANQANAWLSGNKADLSAVTYLGAASGGFYTIDSAQDLKDMLGLVYNPANNFKLSTNLSLTAGWYLPVLTGTFDGNGYALGELNVNQDYNANIGFVGRLLGGTVHNLMIYGATLNGYANVGGIAGVMRGNTFVLDNGSTDNGSFTDGATITDSVVVDLNYNVVKTFDSSWDSMENGVGYYSIGGLVGTAQGKSVISNSHSLGTITMDIKNDGSSNRVEAWDIGGLVGYAYGDGIVFDHVSSDVAISLTATALKAVDQWNNRTDIELGEVGGLVGYMGGDNTNAVLSNASATGAISVTTKNFYDVNENKNDYSISDIGGLVGYADGLDATTLSATNTINVKGDSVEYVGGIAGESYDSNYDGVTRTGDITINPAEVTTDQYSEVYTTGGIIGYSENDTIVNAIATGTITLGTADAPINYAESVGGAVGQADGTNIDTTVSSVAIAATNVDEGDSFGGLVGQNAGYNSKVNKDTYQTTFTSGDLTAQYNDAKTAYLARVSVIALLAQGYELYDGSYDGSTYYDISFSMVKKNVELGNISNSSASGSVIAPNIYAVGGLVGYNYLDGDSGAVISNSHASGEVKGLNTVGGLVGDNEGGNIVNSYATGKVTGIDTNGNVGGLVGYNDGWDSTISDYPSATSEAIYNSEAEAQAAEDAYVLAYEAAHPEYSQGGINANIYQGGADNKYYYDISMNYYKNVAVGTITGSHATGEVVGLGATYVGGLVGYNYNDGDTGAAISSSYATGKVTGGSEVGGLVGQDYSSTITNVYSRGEVEASGNNVGSLMGQADGTTLTNSYASGKITLTGANQTSVNGLIGNVDASITNSFYDKTVNAAMNDEADYGKTTTELKTLATYTTDLGDGAWDMSGQNGSYPILGFQTDGAETTWVMAEGSTPTPTPTPTSPTVQQQVNNIVTTIVNQATVTPSAPTVTTVTQTMPQQTPTQMQNSALAQTVMTQQGNNSGGTYNLVGSTGGASAVQTVTMDQLQTAATTQGVGDIHVPLGNNSMIDLVNGGVTLPTGVSQEFYVVASNTTGTSTTNNSADNSSNNKKSKKN